VLGQENLSDYGVARLTLFCKDSTGHIVVEAGLRTIPDELGHGAESAVVQVLGVVADVDRFEQELRNLETTRGISAVL
jgi:hypothetical protein